MPGSLGPPVSVLLGGVVGALFANELEYRVLLRTVDPDPDPEDDSEQERTVKPADTVGVDDQPEHSIPETKGRVEPQPNHATQPVDSPDMTVSTPGSRDESADTAEIEDGSQNTN